MIPIGHDAQISTLLSAARDGRMHHAWLFTGPEGIGKAMVAQLVATRLLAEASAPPPRGDGPDIDPDHQTARLIAAGAHSDFIWLTRLTNEKSDRRARNISIDQVRAVGARFALAPALGDRRIVVIDAVDDLERSAANALLKNLEEPPASTVFFLISHAPGRLLPTVRSRCRVLRFAPLDGDAMRRVLRDAVPEADPYARDTLIRMADGAPGKALALAGLDMAAIETALETMAREGDPTNALRTKLAAQLALKAAQPRYAAFLARVPSFIAAHARSQTGLALDVALDAYAQASDLAVTAPLHNVDPQSAVFELCGLVAGLAKAAAPPKRAA